mmetsp:Transcript_13525/g.18527  ORF Transcript_13525/g.18527 Transcript_13525/m.18527 type:complete len:161 (-) Transcript_13525:133-615(-)
MSSARMNLRLIPAKRYYESAVSDTDSETSCQDSISRKKSRNGEQPKYHAPQNLSKQEASAWRRNERKLRNRASAAASRQRQRSRISELEAEVSSLKALLAQYTGDTNVFTKSYDDYSNSSSNSSSYNHNDCKYNFNEGCHLSSAMNAASFIPKVIALTGA